ncbi:MAG: TetR/AcrR family transcriptional regulator, partial [Clostridiales bacterium]|nr:TetR/AcrR family transcriptional regulator [Clostridiales bacterium]
NKCKRLILESAKKIFFQHGYGNTTIGIISKHAGIGVGTVYNYFGSKAELYIHVMSELFESPQIDNVISVSGKEGMCAAETVFVFINTYIDMFEKIDKQTLKEIFAIFFGTSSEHVTIREVMIKLDYNMIGTIGEMLSNLADQGKLEENFAVDECASTLFSIFGASIMMYVYGDNVNLNDIRQAIKKQIDFIVR